MSNKAGPIVLILGGVALVYLAATGYAGGVWEALKGPKGSDMAADSAKSTQMAGGASRALGRGMGGQVSNVPYVDKGVFYPSPAGGLMASDAGVW